MKKNKYSFIHLMLRFTMLINIIVIIIGVSFVIVNNENLMPYIFNESYRNFILSLNKILLTLGSALVLLNLLLYILNNMYSKQKYFRVLEKIDLDSIENAINLTKNMSSFDEYGYMGEKLKNFLEIYLKFSQIKKLKLELEQQKFQYLMDFLPQGAMLLNKNKELFSYRIRFINNAAQKILHLEEKKSFIIGKNFESILDRASADIVHEIVDTFNYEKIKNMIETPTRAALHIQTNLAKLTQQAISDEEKDKEPKYDSFEVDILPFVFRWPYELGDEAQPGGEADSLEETENSLIESILIIFR